MDNHENHMRRALILAREAYDDGETPIGALIVDAHGGIIGRGRNRREKNTDATSHAEIEAISDACKTIGDWRLSGCCMYVTLEPCPMCAGAIIMARIEALYYGAKDELTGSCGSVINLFMEPYNHSVRVRGGILADESSQLLRDFFAGLREA